MHIRCNNNNTMYSTFKTISHRIVCIHIRIIQRITKSNIFLSERSIHNRYAMVVHTVNVLFPNMYVCVCGCGVNVYALEHPITIVHTACIRIWDLFFCTLLTIFVAWNGMRRRNAIVLKCIGMVYILDTAGC